MNFIDLIYPLRCPVCDRVLPLGERICQKCYNSLGLVGGALCRKCGKGLKDERQEYCEECLNRRHLFTEGRVLCNYEDIRRSIYRFKYMKRREYGDFYGNLMARHLGASLKAWRPDALVPVPLHKKRQRKRGYNQALILAKALGKYTGIPVRDDLIKRCINTSPMKTLSIKQREKNLKRAFKIESDVVKLNTIVLVDDIYTTGSTIDAMALEFLLKGVRNVYYVALAMAGE